MKTFILRNKKLLIGCFSILLAVLTMLCFLPKNVTKASADTGNSELKNNIDSVTFIGFNKAENEELNKMVFANYFFPEGVMNENYTYGVFIVPTDYVARYELTDDYIEILTEKGVQFLTVEANGSYDCTGGKFIRFGLVNIFEANLDRNMFYIIYAKDNATGLYEYGVSASASYNALSTNNQSVDLTKYVTLETYNSLRNQANERIAEKDEIIAELEASLSENGVDMSKFKTEAEYNQMKAELEARIAELEDSLDTDQDSEQPKDGMSFKQILGISLGAVLLVAIVVVVVTVKNKRKGDYK